MNVYFDLTHMKMHNSMNLTNWMDICGEGFLHLHEIQIRDSWSELLSNSFRE